MSFWQKITGFFFYAYKWLWPILKPYAQDVAKSGGRYLLELASEAAQRAEKTELGSYDKLKYATDYLLNKVETDWESAEFQEYKRHLKTTTAQRVIIDIVDKYNREGW